MSNTKNKPKAWAILATCLIPPLALLVFVIISETWNTHFSFLSGLQKDCKQLHMSSGFLRKNMSLARMSAVSSWIKKVKPYGVDYTFWTNADRKSLRCKKVSGTKYINCIAWAKPCKLIYTREDEKLMVHNISIKK